MQPTEVGAPQGGPLSPILSNILLDDLDNELERRGLSFVRYADDFAIFAKSERAAKRIMASVTRYLTDHLRLVVNQEKSQVVASKEFEFLGFAFRKSQATINVSRKSQHRFKHRIREITGRSRGISMDQRLSELRTYVRGWTGYFGLASQLKLFDRLDQWIRRRIRMCYWTIGNNGVAHGNVGENSFDWAFPDVKRSAMHAVAKATGICPRQSPVAWDSRTLAEQGLLSMKTLWAELAPLRRIA